MFCPHCGVQIAAAAQFCGACGASLAQQPIQSAQPLLAFAPRTSPLAIWSLILGVLGLITCGIGSIAGFVLGILGLKQCREKPSEFTGSGLAIAGIVVSSLFAFIGLIACLSAILLPAFRGDREAARMSSCLGNLKQCAQALKMYTDDYDGTLPSSALVGGNYVTFGCTSQVLPPVPPRVSWPAILYDNMRNKDIMFCPSDSADHLAGGVTLSYWYKFANDNAWSLGKQKMGDYGYESDQIAFFEYKGWHFGDQSGLRDGIQYNMAFMDTHVETVVLTDGPAIAIDTPAGANALQEPFAWNTQTDAAGAVHQHTLNNTDPSMNYDSL